MKRGLRLGLRLRLRGDFHPFLIVILILILILIAVTARASTVNFSFQDLSGAPIANAKVIVTPIQAPFVTGPLITGANTFPFYTSASGTAQIPDMQQGLYNVRLVYQPATTFNIQVPNDSLTYNASQILTNLLIFTNNAVQPTVVTAGANTAVTNIGTQFSPNYLVTSAAGGTNFDSISVKNLVKAGVINGIQAPYYIGGPYGSDGNDGLTYQTALATPTYADAATPQGSTRLLIGGFNWFTNGAQNLPYYFTNSGVWASYSNTQAVLYSTNTNSVGIVWLGSNNITLSNLNLVYNKQARTNNFSPNLAACVFLASSGNKGLTNDAIINCTLSNGCWGIDAISTNLSAGITGLQITGNHIIDCGAAGIMGDCTTQPPASLLNTNWLVANNTVELTHGLEYTGIGIGISLLAQTGLIYTNNLTQKNGFEFPNSGGGSGGVDFVYTALATIENNLSRWNVTTPGGNDGFGYDFDKSSSNNLVMLNEAYGNSGPGIENYSAGAGNTYIQNIIFGDCTAYIFGVSSLQFGSEFDFDIGAYAVGITNETLVSNICTSTFADVTPIYYDGAATYGTNKLQTNSFNTTGSNGFATASVIVWDDSNGKTGFTGNTYYSEGAQLSWYWNHATYATLASWGVDPTGSTQNPNLSGFWQYWPNEPQWLTMFNYTLNMWTPPASLQVVGTRNTFVGGAGNPNIAGTNNWFEYPDVGASNTIGSYNHMSGGLNFLDNTTGSLNTGNSIGNLISNISGSGNIVSGPFAMQGNLIGSYNVAFGLYSLLFSRQASNNVALGLNAQAFGVSNQLSTSAGAYSLYIATNAALGDANGAYSFSQAVTGLNFAGLGAYSGSLITHPTNDLDLMNEGIDGDVGMIRIGTEGEETNAAVVGAWNFVDSELQFGGVNVPNGALIAGIGVGGAVGAVTTINATIANGSGDPALFSANTQPGNAGGLTNISGASLVSPINQTNLPAIAATNGGTFTGNGAGLTNVSGITAQNACFVYPFGPCFGAFGSSTIGVASANVIYVAPVLPIFQAPTLITKTSVSIQTLFAGGHYSIALFSTNGTKIFDTGPQSTGSTGIFTIPLTNATGFGPVWYPSNGPLLLEFTCDNTTAKFSAVAGFAAGTLIMNNSGQVLIGTAANASTSGQSPATLGVITAATIAGNPILFFQ